MNLTKMDAPAHININRWHNSLPPARSNGNSSKKGTALRHENKIVFFGSVVEAAEHIGSNINSLTEARARCNKTKKDQVINGWTVFYEGLKVEKE